MVSLDVVLACACGGFAGMGIAGWLESCVASKRSIMWSKRYLALLNYHESLLDLNLKRAKVNSQDKPLELLDEIKTVADKHRKYIDQEAHFNAVYPKITSFAGVFNKEYNK